MIELQYHITLQKQYQGEQKVMITPRPLYEVDETKLELKYSMQNANDFYGYVLEAVSHWISG